MIGTRLALDHLEPVYLYEFDPTQPPVVSLIYPDTSKMAPYRWLMLLLPSGQVALSNGMNRMLFSILTRRVDSAYLQCEAFSRAFPIQSDTTFKRGGWSVRDLDRQIATKAYQRLRGKAGDSVASILTRRSQS